MSKPPVNKRKTKKREHITRAAIELFERYGIRRVTVTEICATARVSKVTFYKYFPNKLELAKHVLNVMSEEALARVDVIEAMDRPFEEKIKLFIEERTELARRISPHLMEDIYHADAAFDGFVRERGLANRRHFIAFIERAQRHGDVRADLRPEIILEVTERLNDLARDRQLVDLYGGYDQLTREANTLLFYGILQREGDAPRSDP